MKVPAGIIAALLLVSACTGQPPGGTSGPGGDAERALSAPVSITLWHAQTGSLAKALTDLVARFNAENGQGITVVLAYQGNVGPLHERTRSAIQSGTLPELVTGTASALLEYQRASVVLDLDPYLTSARNGLDRAGRDDIFRTYLDAGRPPHVAGLLSFPFARSVVVMYQNDELLRTAAQVTPRTWDEFEKVARALTTKAGDGKVTRHGWAAPASAPVFYAWVLSRDGRLMSDDNTTVAWDGREGVEAVRLLQKLVQEGVAYVPRGFDHQADFGSGRAAFVHDASGDRPFFASALPRDRRPAWSLVPVPQADPGRAKTVHLGTDLIAFRSTPEKQLASWLFIRWFTEKDQTAEWAMRSGYQPVRGSAADNAALRTHWISDPQGKQAFDLTGTAVGEPGLRGQAEVRAVIEELLRSVGAGGVADVEKAVKDAGAKANQILKDAR